MARCCCKKNCAIYGTKGLDKDVFLWYNKSTDRKGGVKIMTSREYIISELNTLPENVLDKIAEYTRYQRIILTHTPPKKQLKFGGWEDKIWISDDFDEPLEDFAEYM
jgi:hypothetical protein